MTTVETMLETRAYIKISTCRQLKIKLPDKCLKKLASHANIPQCVSCRCFCQPHLYAIEFNTFVLWVEQQTIALYGV